MCRRSKLAVASIAMVGITLSGCGVADSGDATSDASSSSNASSGSDHDKMLGYAQCLRENGLEVEDPRPGEGVRLQGKDEDVEPALQACEDLEPAGAVVDDPEAARDDMLQIARCMREHAVEDFPDPKPGEGIDIDGRILEDPDYEDARKSCDPNMPGPGEVEER